MPEGKATECKGMCTADKVSGTDDITNSETDDSAWKTAGKLKQEVQTIIDIMGPSSPKFCHNTSSEADNEESIFSNSKFSSIRYKARCDCNDYPEKIDACFKDEPNISTAADINTTTISTTLDDFTDSKVNFSYGENVQYICPPPILPPDMHISSECFCPQVANRLLQGRAVPAYYPANSGVPGNIDSNIQNVQIDKSKCCAANKDSKNALINWLKTIVSTHKTGENGQNNCKYYKMNVKRQRGDDNSPPRRVIFDLVHDPSAYNQYDNTNNRELKTDCTTQKDQKNIDNEKVADIHGCERFKQSCALDCPTTLKKPINKGTVCGGDTKVDVYYFDHGSLNHYRTTDTPPLVSTEAIADKTEKHTTRFWAEIFGSIHIGVSFITSFILQLFRFILYSIFRPLTIGLIQLASDYLFKPLLATVFNGIIQPILIFFYNIFASLRDICDPIAEGIGYFLREAAVLVRAFRLVEVNNETCGNRAKCDKKCKRDRSVC